MEFRQSGTQVTGTLRFANGAVATISGVIQQNTLNFRWRIGNSPVHGSGRLVASANGNRLTGTYQDLSQQTSGPFNLTRIVAAPLPAPPLPALP